MASNWGDGVKRRFALPAASIHIALGSTGALAAQILFSLLMLRMFEPQAVGEFSVISQFSFVWMTLALAQSPLKLLADVQLAPRVALRAALLASFFRLTALSPMVVLGVWMSAVTNPAATLVWITLLAILQMCWYLAQSLTLRTMSSRMSALGRALPPLLALLVAAVFGSSRSHASVTSLLLAAATGYAVGALWLLPFNVVGRSGNAKPEFADSSLQQADSRSAVLRMAHAAADALTGVALLVAWQRTHGLTQAGYLAVLLRIMSVVPTMIYSAWMQVLLAQGNRHPTKPHWVGLAGGLFVALMGAFAILAILQRWLPPSWEGMLPYVAPIVLWQASACMLAAVSHLPFQVGKAMWFSYGAMAFDAVQLLVLWAPLAWGFTLTATTHAWYLSGVSALGLMGLSVWISVKCRMGTTHFGIR